MNAEELEEMREKAEDALEYYLANPIDFHKLINDGLLKKIGTSYYTDNIYGLPKNALDRIKTSEVTKKGLKLTFYK